MPLPAVLASISWRAPSNQWPLIGLSVTDVSSSDRSDLIAYISAAYASPTAAGIMDLAANTGTIRIGTSGSFEPGTYSGYYDTPGSYLGFNVSAIDKLHYFNKTGTFVKEVPAITIAHEFVHFVLKAQYVDPSYSESAMNGANYQFDPLITIKQNEIATELHELNNLQASYFSSVMQGDGRFSSLVVGHSYTDGNVVDVVRLGDMTGNTADNIDHTLRSSQLNDLLFGFTEIDTIKSGKGNDYIYGGAGADKLYGGEGRDVLVGEADNDEFWGGTGNDVIWGGVKGNDQGKTDGTDIVDYSGVGGNIAITFTGEDGAVTLTVVDGEGGLDELHSIEKIVATSRTDYLTLNGEIPDSYVPGSGTHSLEIDMGLGVDVIANASQASGAIIVDIDNTGTGTATSPATGGVIHLLNAKTQILGSAYDDEITDLVEYEGVKRIDGGAGNDVLVADGSDAWLNGGAGDDIVTGGNGDDVLMGSAHGNNEADQLNGGGGDYILGKSAWETIDCGDGHDYIQAFVTSTVRGGAGNDFIIFGNGISCDALARISNLNISHMSAANNNDYLVDLRSCA